MPAPDRSHALDNIVVLPYAWKGAGGEDDRALTA